jgi:hypothetical protein
MSAEPEGVFSDGSELITDKRNGLGDDAVKAEMIQKNWITSKVLCGIAVPRGGYINYLISDRPSAYLTSCQSSWMLGQV